MKNTLIAFFKISKKNLILLSVFLCACGIRGPLYLPAPPPTPAKPTQSEPENKLYPPTSSKDSSGSASGSTVSPKNTPVPQTK